MLAEDIRHPEKDIRHPLSLKEDIRHPEKDIRHPLSLKGGRKKYKRQKKDKRGRDRAPSQEGSLEKRGFQTPGNTLPAESVASLGKQRAT